MKPLLLAATLIALYLLAASQAAALPQGPPPDGPATPFSAPLATVDTLRPVRVTEPPVIDGEFNEPFWKLAPSLTNFKTFLPDFDVVPKEQTEVALAYDAENIYFGFRCYDDPSLIKASVSARDKMILDDFVCVNLDAANDQQGLNAFYVNPFGIQGDSRFAANNEDFSPDFVWYSAGKVDSVGYTVEIQLPLKSLRYRNVDPTVMGVVLERYIRRRDEHSCVPRLDPAKGFALLTQMLPVSYPGVEHYTLWEILPALTATRQDVNREGDLVKDKQEAELSLTGKYGITTDLILDGTINPDFSQVESDADNFNLGATSNDYDPRIFYSRTIADPEVGAKLTGKVWDGNTLAALYALDNVLEQDRSTLGRYVHNPVIRYKRALAEDSYVGFLYAGRELEESNNRVAGFDEIIRVGESSTISGNGFVSSAKDGAESEAVEGHTLGAIYEYSDRDLSYSLAMREVSQDFRADMGYVTRTGLVYFLGYLNPRIYFQPGFFNRLGFEFMTVQLKDRPSGLWETYEDAAMNLFFGGSWLFRVRGQYSTEIFDAQEFQTNGVFAQVRGQISNKAFVQVVYGRARSILYSTPEQGGSNAVTVALTLDPWENFRADAGFQYSDFTPDATGEMLYVYKIGRLKLTYQVNQYLFFRGIGEYNDYYQVLDTEFLASFTYIPGTVFYLGWGSIFEKVQWDGAGYAPSGNFLEMQRGLFLKMSYLWRS
jgi:hypothetical protein